MWSPKKYTHLIYLAFDYDKTTEGEDFWVDKSVLWQCHIRKQLYEQ